MSGIYHKGKEWANVTTPNPEGTASTDLTKVGIDGTNYNIKDANAAPNTPTFSEASTRANLAGSGESMSTILGKIKKWFTDLKAVAFSGSYNDLSDQPTIPSDTKVTQTKTSYDSSVADNDFPVLFAESETVNTKTEGARKNTDLRYNPHSATLRIPNVESSNIDVYTVKVGEKINQLLTGSGTTGQDKGSGQANRYVPSVWTFNAGITPIDGDEIMIKIPAAGISYGVWLSVDNGTTYYPVGRNDTSRLQTQFANGTTIHLVFQTNANFTIYARGGADSSTTYTGNYWKVVNYYDTNTTYSVVSTSANGLAPKVTDTSKFLKGDGTWAVPTDSTKIPLAGTTELTGSIVPSTDKSISLGDLTKTFYSAFAAMFAAGRAGNQTGSVRFFHSGESSVYTDLKPTKPTSIQTLYLPNSSGTLATEAWATQEINLDGTMTFTNTSYSGSATRSYAARAIRGTRMVWLMGGAGEMKFSAFPTTNAFHKIASGLPKAKYTAQFWMVGMRSTTAGCVFQIDGNGDLTCNVAGQSSRVNDYCWFNYVYLAADSYF